MLRRRPVTGLLGDAAQLGQGLVVGGGDVGDVAEREDGREAVDGQVGQHVDPPAAALGDAELAASGAAISPPPQTSRWVWMVVPSLSADVARADVLDRGAQPELDPRRCSCWPRRRGPPPRTAPSTAWPRSTRIPGRRRRRGAGRRGASRHGRARPARPRSRPRSAPPPTTTKVSAPSSTSSGLAVGVLEQLQDPGAQPFGVVERVERERELGRPRGCGRSSAGPRRPARARRR